MQYRYRPAAAEIIIPINRITKLAAEGFLVPGSEPLTSDPHTVTCVTSRDGQLDLRDAVRIGPIERSGVHHQRVSFAMLPGDVRVAIAHQVVMATADRLW